LDDYADDEEYEAQTGEVVSSVSQALSPISAEEKTLLRQLSEYAAKSSQRPDCKAQTLIDWLKASQRPSGKWNDERVIIFTEYRATQKWLFDLLAREGFAEQGRLEMIYGGMPNDQREPIKAAFQANPKESAVRILLATDAASEGVNLQNHCSKLIHFESSATVAWIDMGRRPTRFTFTTSSAAASIPRIPQAKLAILKPISNS
jgi:superfamily II DNA/RNA helicase